MALCFSSDFFYGNFCPTHCCMAASPELKHNYPKSWGREAHEIQKESKHHMAGKIKFAGFLKASPQLYRRSKQSLAKETSSRPAELQGGFIGPGKPRCKLCRELHEYSLCESLPRLAGFGIMKLFLNSLYSCK